MKPLRQPLFKQEQGFSLAELLIVTAILPMMMAAVFLVYQGSQRIYLRSSSLEAAQAETRFGIDTLARDLRLIGSYCTGACAPITALSSSSITFWGDIDGDTVIGDVETTTVGSTLPATTVVVSGSANAFAVGEFLSINDGAVREVLQIAAVAGSTITLSAALSNTYPAGSVVRTVERVTYTYDAAARTLTRTVPGLPGGAIAENVTNFTLSYFNSAQAPTSDPTQVREIRISLMNQGTDGGRRTMVSTVRPRNL